MSVIIFERNGSYGNAAPKLKNFFSIKIPIWDELESDDYKLTRFPFGLAGPTTATIAFAFAISEKRSNFQWNFPMTTSWKIIVPRDTDDSSFKS